MVVCGVKTKCDAGKNGINDALFKVRISNSVLCKRPNEVYSFFMGVILCDEIRYILLLNPPKISIGGKKQIKESMAVLLRKYSSAHIVVIPDSQVQEAASLGLIKIYEYDP